MGPLEGTILVKTSRMRGVEINARAKRARVRAGALWGEVVPAAAEQGLAALAGSAKDVGVVGYTLGGGIGWLARRHGLACSSVLAVEAVAADGRIVRADADSEQDLYWALRGGGGGFAVVTALEFALYQVAEVYAGALFWPLERAGEVLHTWRELVAEAPHELTSSAALCSSRRFPRSPSRSAVVRSRSSRPPTVGRKPTARRCSSRCAGSPRRWTRSPRSRRTA